MIQRIQTVYLLLATLTLGGLAALPFAKSTDKVVGSTLFSDQQFDLFDHSGLLIGFGLTALLFLIAILMFNNRATQMWLVRLGIIVLILGLLFGGFLLFQDQSQLATATINPQLGSALPIIGILLAILANRAIKKDDNLVRSSDRLR